MKEENNNLGFANQLRVVLDIDMSLNKKKELRSTKSLEDKKVEATKLLRTLKKSITTTGYDWPHNDKIVHMSVSDSEDVTVFNIIERSLHLDILAYSC